MDVTGTAQQPEFLVEIEIDLPAEMTDRQRSELQSNEEAVGRELLAAGRIQRIWRIPGRTANVGIWAAPDASALHASITSLPMFRWMTVTVRALAVHPLEAASTTLTEPFRSQVRPPSPQGSSAASRPRPSPSE